MDPLSEIPRTGNVFFGIQYAFSPNWTLEADYLGTWGRHLFSHPDVNRMNGSIIQNNGVLVRPNTSFGVISYGESNETSDYNGATFAVTKRYSRGLSFQGSFTIGKAIDFNSLFVGGGNNPTDQVGVANQTLDRGLADFDISKKFALTAIWDLPVPNFSSKSLSKMPDGWELSDVLTLQSGPLFSVICSTPFVAVRNASGAVVGDSGCDYNCRWLRLRSSGTAFLRQLAGRPQPLRLFERYLYEIYVGLPASTGEPPKRLAGWARVQLDPGETQRATVVLDPNSASHPLSFWNTHINGWDIANGDYTVYVGDSSSDIRFTHTLHIDN